MGAFTTQRFVRRYSSHKMIGVFSCLSFSPDGRFLAAGEAAQSTGRYPDVLVWELHRSKFGFHDNPVVYGGESEESEHFCLKGHKIGVKQVAFSPCSKYLVSLGDHLDRGLFVWSLKAGIDSS